MVEAKSGPKPLPPGYSEVQDEVVDVDDGELSESEVEEAVEEKVLAKVEEHEGNEVEEVEALAPVGSEKAKAKEKPGYTTAGYTEVEEEQKDDDLSVSSSSAPPVVKEFVAEQKPFEQKRELSGAKYKYVSEVRDVHRGEHEAGSVVLKMIYDELQTHGKQLDSDGKRTGWKKLDEPGVVPFEDDDDRAAFLKSKWQWGRNTFDKYYRRLVQLFGGTPPDPEVETPTSELVEEVHEEEDESEARQSEQRAPVDTKYSDLPGEGSDQDPDSLASDLSESEQEEEEAKEEAKEPEDAPGAPIKVKAKKTEEDRAKYRLQLGTPMVRGAETKPFDTASMTTNRAGAGWAIFVMTSQGQVYAGSHKVGIFHHSSFLGGGQTAGAGEIKVAGGKLTALTNKSGHYIPGDLENLQVIAELQQAGIAPSSYSFLNYTPDEKKTQYATAEEYMRAVQLKPEKDLKKERERYKR